MDQRSDREFPHVAVIGGGIAGLEALLALRDLAEGRVSLTLVSPEPDFSYRPLAVDEPFAGAPVERRELAPIAQELGTGFVQQALAGIDPERRALELADGSALSYDAAVICVGGRARPAYRDAVTFWSPGEPFDADELLRQSAAEDPKRMAFVVPPGVTWPLPLYEIALMSRRRAEELGLRDLELELVTPESAPLVMFGPLAAQAVAELLSARRIEIRSGAWASEAKDGSLVLTPGQDRLTHRRPTDRRPARRRARLHPDRRARARQGGRRRLCRGRRNDVPDQARRPRNPAGRRSRRAHRCPLRRLGRTAALPARASWQALHR